MKYLSYFIHWMNPGGKISYYLIKSVQLPEEHPDPKEIEARLDRKMRAYAKAEKVQLGRIVSDKIVDEDSFIKEVEENILPLIKNVYKDSAE